MLYGPLQKPSDSFVAIDVEYADASRNICQVGIAVVHNLEITERRSWLIQPPGNHYEPFQMSIHGIGPEDTAGKPMFKEAWAEIEHYLDGMELWAHNAGSADQSALEHNFCVHGVDRHIAIRDSRDLYQRPGCPYNKGNGLVLCCMALGITCEKHHDALDDASNCAELVIRYLKGQKPEWGGVPMSDEELRKSCQDKLVLHPGEFTAHRNRQKEGADSDEDGERPDLFAIVTSSCEGASPQTVDVYDKGDLIPKDGRDLIDIARLDTAEDNPLRGKIVAITGFFHIVRSEIERAVEAMGATTDGVTRNTDILLIGLKNVSLEKLSKYEKQKDKGHDIALVVGDEDLDALLYGDGRKFF